MKPPECSKKESSYLLGTCYSFHCAIRIAGCLQSLVRHCEFWQQILGQVRYHCLSLGNHQLRCLVLNR